MRRWFFFLGILLYRSGQAQCPVPAEFDAAQLSYSVDKLASSARVVVQLPVWKTLACTVTSLSTGGNAFEFDLAAPERITLRVYGLDGGLVQSTSLGGRVILKSTPTVAAIQLFNAAWQKTLLDHRLRVLELWNTSTLFPAPFAQVEDQGQIRSFPLTRVP